MTIADVISAAEQGQETLGFECFAMVDPVGDCPVCSEEVETWSDWLAKQAPWIVPADPGDGFLYFGTKDSSGFWPGTKLLLMYNNGAVLLTAEEYRAATTVETGL